MVELWVSGACPWRSAPLSDAVKQLYGLSSPGHTELSRSKSAKDVSQHPGWVCSDGQKVHELIHAVLENRFHCTRPCSLHSSLLTPRCSGVGGCLGVCWDNRVPRTGLVPQSSVVTGSERHPKAQPVWRAPGGGSVFCLASSPERGQPRWCDHPPVLHSPDPAGGEEIALVSGREGF